MYTHTHTHRVVPGRQFGVPQLVLGDEDPVFEANPHYTTGIEDDQAVAR